ncbi:hypothetical protein RDI58_005109 [Solanum bulbocastanum]|uniref:Uncharacterized protein n=1 Tax=Solanum bulbocastanum TaxID=147425 RepID=A0AAN8U7T3_SOLBU
MLFTIPNKNKE